jgi:peptidoglycan/LPS O-acetylase OafA/YrhL
MTVSPNRTYFPAIDQLRGFAATLVLFYHGLRLIGPHLGNSVESSSSNSWISSFNPFVALIEEGHTGVAMFIVLSGFILSLGPVDKFFHPQTN